MPESQNPQQNTQELEQQIQENLQPHIQRIAKLLASKSDADLFGKTEFELRDLVHELAAEALQTRANPSEKKGVPGC